jgi:hypothetical protein
MHGNDKVNTVKVNSGNLRALCWARGFRGVPGLARRIRRHRITIWRAVRNPKQYGPTYQKISEALNA